MNAHGARRAARERGVAAVELALTMGVLLTLMLLVAPLAQVMVSQQRLERVAGAADRFATQADDRPRPDCSGDTAIPHPGTACVQSVAAAWLAQAGESATPTVTVSSNPTTSAPGTPVTVTMTITRDLGPFGWLMSVTGFSAQSQITLSASSVRPVE
jgi:hypothetical protein